MLLVFVAIATLLIIAATLGIDIAGQIHAEKKAKREKAIATLQQAITERFNERISNDITLELRVLDIPQQKKPYGGRHRLHAA